MKEATKKILSPHGVLSPSDLTADEKKEIYALFEEYEMPQSTAYIRLFTKGFDEWELQGINNVKADFCTENNLQDLAGVGEGFYSSLPFMSGLKVKLVNFVALLGMEHRNTVNKRFDADDWKKWERIGVRSIIDRLNHE